MAYNSLDARALNNSGTFAAITDALRGIGDSYMRNRDRQMERETLRDQAMREARWKDRALAIQMAKESGVAPGEGEGVGLGDMSGIRAIAAQRQEDLKYQQKQRAWQDEQIAAERGLMPLRRDMTLMDAGSKGLMPDGYTSPVEADTTSGVPEPIAGNSLRDMAMGGVPGVPGATPQTQGYGAFETSMRRQAQKDMIERAKASADINSKNAGAEKARAEAVAKKDGVTNIRRDSLTGEWHAVRGTTPVMMNEETGEWENVVKPTPAVQSRPLVQAAKKPTSAYPDGEFTWWNPDDYRRAIFGSNDAYTIEDKKADNISDGPQFTAEDVRWNFEQIKTLPTDKRRAWLADIAQKQPALYEQMKLAAQKDQ